MNYNKLKAPSLDFDCEVEENKPIAFWIILIALAAWFISMMCMLI